MVNEKEWRELSAYIGKNGEALCEALKELYAVFSPEIVDWYASLYDPEHGMWYHCKSAQENEGYLPDIESLCDAMSFMEQMGATGGKTWYDLFPFWLIKRVKSFILDLQDEDGYFYHPQWGKEIHNIRKSRDLGTCWRFLNSLEAVPKYKIPIADSEDDEFDFDLSKAPEQYRSVENFKAYLDSMDFENKSYLYGSELSSSMGEVETYGKVLGEDLVSIVLECLSLYEREDNGIWFPQKTIAGGDGAQKLSKIYNWYGRKIPYVDKGIETIMEIIMSNETPSSIVQVYNPWHALASFVNNKRCHCDSKAEYDNLVERLRIWAPAAIRKSTERVKIFKQSDGAFSYLINEACYTKCGAPCGVPHTREGDVNGTAGGSAALISGIYDALQISDYTVPVYSDADMKRFISIVEKRENDYLKSKK